MARVSVRKATVHFLLDLLTDVVKEWRCASKPFRKQKNWLDEAKYEDKHSDALLSSKTTVNEWFEFWLENLVSDLAPNTIRNYRERYTRDVRPVIGDLRLSDVKPMETAWSFKRSNDNGSVCSRFRGIYV